MTDPRESRSPDPGEPGGPEGVTPGGDAPCADVTGAGGAGADGAAGAVDPLLTPLSRRRTILAGLAGGLGVLAGSAVLVPWLRLFLTPVERSDPELWRPVGSAGDFSVGDTVRVTYLDPAPLPWAGFAARNAAWVRRDSDEEFTAFTSYCTHVGCPIRWEAAARLFFCPCHGGAFYEDGTVAAGPPPRPLDRYPIRVRDGVVEIRTMGVPSAS
jgi:menaquinol-cytochrome c reductase iron-sulfur subunit